MNSEVKESKQTDAQKLMSLLESKKNKDKKIAVFSHTSIDPDSIGSMSGVKFFVENLGYECDMFFDGEISHPQNKGMVQILDVPLKKTNTYEADSYFFHILVDTIPINAGIGKNDIKFDLVIDHHKDLPNGNYNGMVVHSYCASASSLVYELLADGGVKFEDDNEDHTKIATSLLVGIITDSGNLLSVDTTQKDFKAYEELFKFRNADLLKKIINFSRPISWMKLKTQAYNNVVINDGVAIAGLGILDVENRDIIPDLATDLLSWGSNLQIVVVFALFNDRLEGSIRTNNEAIEVNKFCQLLGSGNGGGKSCKGAYKKYLGDFCIDENEDEELQEEMWNAIKKREIARILKVVKK
jgi:nanoRNase/pAp phosphatase (c-di-AMP/oligoRNAs hydrolase)